MSVDDELLEKVAVMVEEKVRRRIYSRVPRGGILDLSTTAYVDRGEDGRISINVDVEVRAHPGLRLDVDKLVDEAVEEALREADRVLRERGLKPEG